MKRYGENPYGEAMFRVIWSDSRTDLIGGKWPDGVCEYREARRYPNIHGWVLEKWQTPEEYAGTREQYEASQKDPDSGLFTCGPYPQRGEYAYCFTFTAEPGEHTVSQIVWAIKVGRGITPQQQRDAIIGKIDAADEQRANRFDAIFDDSMGPFQNADTVVSMSASTWGRQGFKRASDMPIVHNMERSPLPTQDNWFGQGSKRLVSELGGVS
jgi:hypothetical protein